ncbi:MAG: nuclear transport factor 2 family protein [Acidobacteriia bacterium]|nr:nuclear transport factor 2 family protein [Terriglobia bacterium]
MKKRILAIIPAGLLLASSAVAEGNCDRACLEGFVDRYLDAMVAHNPKAVPLAPNVRFTENGQRLVIPDALWNSMESKGSYRLFVSDPETGQVAFIGTIKEQGRAPGQGVAGAIALRLKVVDQRITEAEQLVVRTERTAQNLEKLGKPNPLFLEDIPPAERMSRADLIKTANLYFSGMEKNDGKGVYPFTDDCNRIENGSQTTNAPAPPGQARPDPKTSTNYSAQWSCKEQFESGLLHFVWRIRDRRFVAVDPERGLVFAFGFFDHALGKDRTFQTPEGRTVTGGPSQPWTWEIAEMFKVEKGKLRQIEAILDRAPYGMISGWSNWEDGMSSRARDVK